MPALTDRPIWQDDSCQRHAQLRGDVRADVVLVGGGLTALVAAWLLGRHGVRVAVVEAATVGSGASGSGLGILSMLSAPKADALQRKLGLERAGALLRAHARAVSLLAGIVAEEEIACELQARDVNLYGHAAQAETLLQEHRALERMGIAAQLVEGGLGLLRPARALRLSNQATLHPRQLLCALAAAVARQGGRVYENSPVLQAQEGAVTTGHGAIRAHNIIVTALPLLRGERVQVSPVRLAALRGPCTTDSVWLPAAGGPALRARGELLLAALAVPREDGGASLQQWVAANCADAAVVRQWSSTQACGLDGLPLVGVATPAQPTDLLAVGCGRWGLSQQMVAAQLLCDVVLDRPNELTSVFAPTRRESKTASLALARAGTAMEAAKAFALRLFERE